MLEEHGPVNFPHTCMWCCGMHASTNIHTKYIDRQNSTAMSRTKMSTIKIPPESQVQVRAQDGAERFPQGQEPSVDFTCAGGGRKLQTTSLKPRVTGRWTQCELPSCGDIMSNVPHCPCCPLQMSLNIKARSLQVRPHAHPAHSP